jgi:8-hydroxy-5-deazaflavin:NADPH oxidoreductase
VRIGVLGTGVVGTTIAGKLRELGHDVLIGSRTAGENAVPFADAAAHGELVFNCTNGNASLDALSAAGAENLAGKVLVDVANALDSRRAGRRSSAFRPATASASRSSVHSRRQEWSRR